MAYGWTDPAYAPGSARLDEEVAGIQRLLPQCVQDRAAAAHEWNLFDINAKFGDVVEIAEAVAYPVRL